MQRLLARARRMPRRAFLSLVNRLDAIAVRMRASRSRDRVSACDHRTRSVHGELVLSAYWIDRPGEVGPACSVHWSGQEVLRIDLFDHRGHIHYGQVQATVRPGGGAARVYLPDDLIEVRAERARWELANNLAYCLLTHPSSRVRRLAVELVDLDASAAWLHDQVLDLDRIHRPTVAP